MGTASATLCLARLQDIPLPAARGLLSADEHERARRIAHHEAWLQFVVTRALLRLLLAHDTGRSPRSFDITEGGGAAPRLAANPWGLHFNVSHSHEYAAIAVGNVPLGIDIERADADYPWQASAGICFHADEQERLREMPEAARRAAFFDLWTRKEAYLKGIGTGLGQDPSRFSIGARDGAVVRDAAAAGAPIWYTQSVPAPSGYAAALACRLPRLAILQVEPAALLENLRAATYFAPLGMSRAAWRIPGTNPEWRVKYRAQHRFAPGDVGCRFGSVGRAR
jgi:4'-phosphopantetheinyl transferase